MPGSCPHPSDCVRLDCPVVINFIIVLRKLTWPTRRLSLFLVVLSDIHERKAGTESQFFADSGQKIKFPEAWQERKEEISHREASWTNLRNVMEYGMNVSRDFNEWSDRLWDLRDKRVDGWFMLDSFWPTFLLVAAYLFIVKIWGPRFMENRPAYNINTFLIYYNACQVGLSAYIFVQVIIWFLANLPKM